MLRTFFNLIRALDDDGPKLEPLIPEGNDDGPKLEPLIPEGDDDGPKLEPLIPEGDDDGPKLEALIPEGDDDGPKLEPLIPEGDDDGPKLEPLIPEGDDDGPKLEPLIPEGDDDGPKLEPLIPEGDDDGPKLEPLISEGDDDGPKLEPLIPEHDDDGPKLEPLIPEGDDDGPKLELLIPEGDDDGRPDFGTLPDLVLINIMSRLSFSDRGRLAQTCRALHASYCHPPLWKTVLITLHNPKIAESLPLVEVARYLKVVEPASYLAMVERFGAYFKKLTLIYVGSKYPMSSDCVEVIRCITRCCRYEILTLCPSSRTRSQCPNDLNILAQLFTNQHLKSLWLIGIICFDIRETNGFLERLNLLWQSGFPSWALASPRGMLAVTSKFTELRVLYFNSSMLSDDLIVHLSDKRRARLQELAIEVTCPTFLYPLPRIQASSWIRLHGYSPGLQVHVNVVDLIPDDALYGFLIPEMAVAFLNFIGRSKCADIRSIADRFSSTLRKFVDCTNYYYGHDAELVYMVKKCSHLIHFEYNSPLWAHTIRELAGLRGSRWQHFIVDLDNVVDPRDDISKNKRQLAADLALITRK